jgi:hypothetical protein
MGAHASECDVGSGFGQLWRRRGGTIGPGQSVVGRWGLFGLQEILLDVRPATNVASMQT